MKYGFRLTYVNIFIVTMVVGLTARLVRPQLTAASEETKVSKLIDGLEAMRAHIDLYPVHHDGAAIPCQSLVAFEAAVTTASRSYKPYIRRIPTNPFNNLNTVRFDGEPAGAGIAGWRFDSGTGIFQADNNNACAAI